MELYDRDTIYYIMPLSQQDQFTALFVESNNVNDNGQNNDGEEEDDEETEVDDDDNSTETSSFEEL